MATAAEFYRPIDPYENIVRDGFGALTNLRRTDVPQDSDRDALIIRLEEKNNKCLAGLNITQTLHNCYGLPYDSTSYEYPTIFRVSIIRNPSQPITHFFRPFDDTLAGARYWNGTTSAWVNFTKYFDYFKEDIVFDDFVSSDFKDKSPNLRYEKDWTQPLSFSRNERVWIVVSPTYYAYDGDSATHGTAPFSNWRNVAGLSGRILRLRKAITVRGWYDVPGGNVSVK